MIITIGSGSQEKRIGTQFTIFHGNPMQTKTEITFSRSSLMENGKPCILVKEIFGIAITMP